VNPDSAHASIHQHRLVVAMELSVPVFVASSVSCKGRRGALVELGTLVRQGPLVALAGRGAFTGRSALGRSSALVDRQR
jgi:hypothetical protein